MLRRRVGSNLELKPRDVEQDLVYLRKRGGMTAARFRSTEYLSTFEWDRVEGLVHTWLTSHQGESGAAALAVAFDLDSQYPATALLGRRGAYARQVGRSADTVASWEDDALRDLARWLVRQLDGPTQPVRSNTTIAEYGGYEIDRTQRAMRFEGRRPTRVRTDYRIRAITDNVTNMRIGAQHLGDRTTTEMNFTVSNGRIVSWMDVGNGAIVSVVEFPHPLMTGEVYEFTVDRVIEGRSDPPPFYSYTAHTPTGQLDMELEFATDLPRIAWTFQQIPFHTVPYRPDGTNTIPLTGGRLQARFKTLGEGLSSGIAWRWNEM